MLNETSASPDLNKLSAFFMRNKEQEQSTC
jgi:hypothetical protein